MQDRLDKSNPPKVLAAEEKKSITKTHEIIDLQNLQQILIAEKTLAVTEKIKLSPPTLAPQTYTGEGVLKLIKDQNAIVKVIESKFDDNSHWIFLLQQLRYPYLYRPITKLNEQADRTQILDPTYSLYTHKKREIKGTRGRYKNTEFTKKTSTTLLHPNKMKLFNANGINCGILFDIDQCKLPSNKYGTLKYVFSRNGDTNCRWWIKNNSLQHGKPAAKLKDIRAEHKISDSYSMHNELLAKLHYSAVKAVFATKNILTDRLNALTKKFLVKHWLNIDVPVFVICYETDVFEYQMNDWFQDIHAALELPSTSPAYLYAQICIQEFCIAGGNLWKQFYARVNKLNPSKAAIILNYHTVKTVNKSEEAKAVLTDVSHLGISKENPNYLFYVCKILEWLSVENKAIAQWYAEKLLHEEADHPKLLFTAVSNHFYLALQWFINLCNPQPVTELYVGIAFLLLNYYGETALAETFFLKFKPCLSITTEVGTAFSHIQGVDILSEQAIAEHCTVDQLDQLTLNLASQNNQTKMQKILDLRKDIPCAHWHKGGIGNGNGLLQFLMIDKNPNEILIRRIVEARPLFITKINTLNESPFSLAIKNNHLQLVDYFWKVAHENNLFPQKVSHENNLLPQFDIQHLHRILYYLIQRNHVEKAKKLLEHEVFSTGNNLQNASHKLHIDNQTGNSTLHLTVSDEKPNLELVKQVARLEPVPHENAQGNTAVIISIQKQQMVITGYLLFEYKGAYTQLQLAKILFNLIKYKQYRLAEKIIQLHPQLPELCCFRFWDQTTGNHALHLLIEDSKANNFELIKKFLQFPDAIQRKNNHNQSLFMMAIAHNHVSTLEYLTHQKDLYKQFSEAEKVAVCLELLKRYQWQLLLDFLNNDSSLIPLIKSTDYVPLFCKFFAEEMEHKISEKNSGMNPSDSQPLGGIQSDRQPLGGIQSDRKQLAGIQQSGDVLEMKASSPQQVLFTCFKLLTKNCLTEQNLELGNSFYEHLTLPEFTNLKKLNDDRISYVNLLTLSFGYAYYGGYGNYEVTTHLLNHYMDIFGDVVTPHAFARNLINCMQDISKNKMLESLKLLETAELFLKKSSHLLFDAHLKNFLSAYIKYIEDINKMDHATRQGKSYWLNIEFLMHIRGTPAVRKQIVLDLVKYIFKESSSARVIINVMDQLAKLREHLSFLHPLKLGFFEKHPYVDIMEHAHQRLAQLHVHHQKDRPKLLELM